MILYKVANYVPYEGEFNILYYLNKGSAIAEVERRRKEDVDVLHGYEHPEWTEIKTEDDPR